MTKVAIIIPTMNRPDFLLRHLEFYELTRSPHPVYVSDSSNPENAQKIKDGIKKFTNLSVVYQWAPPGKDCIYQLLPLVKEKYCIQAGDDDLVIPSTISECADFLEENPDYGTCMGKQVNIRFRKEDYIKPYGLIAQQTALLGRSMEDEDILARVKNFWTDTYFICFVVRRTETERSIRNITKHFPLMERMLEFLLVSILIICGKAKVINKLGYVMQISDNRYNFPHPFYLDFLLAPDINDKWKIAQDGLAEIIQRSGLSLEESLIKAKGIFIFYIAQQFSLDADSFLVNKEKQSEPARSTLSKRVKYLISRLPFIKRVYYKFHPPEYVDQPESKYFEEFKVVKDFLEKNSTIS